MAPKLGFCNLILLGILLICDGRQFGSHDVSDIKRNEQVCTLCEQFTTQAIAYLAENKTQIDIIDSLHQTCAKLHTLERQCISLVDYYAPLFFVEISSINPDDFCRKVNLCEDAILIPEQRQNSCDLCHQAIVEILLKIKDPDTQLDIIEALVKACDKAEKYAKQCKKAVFEYGPIILMNAEQFLENKDLCTSLHICNFPAFDDVILGEHDIDSSKAAVQ